MISFDATSFGKSSGVTSITQAHPCTGIDLLLIVVSINGANKQSDTVTYAGVSMSRLTAPNGTNLNTQGFDIWYQFSPTTGTNNIISTMTGAQQMIVMASSFAGVLQSGFPDAGNSTASVTPVATGCWAISALERSDAGQITITNFTQRQSSNGDNTFTNGALGDSNGIVSGNQTFTYSAGTAQPYTFSIAPSLSSRALFFGQ